MPRSLSALSARRGHDKIPLAALTLSLSVLTQVGDRTHNFNHATRLSHRDCIRRSTRYGAKGSAQHTISFLLRISGVDLRPEGTSSLIQVRGYWFLLLETFSATRRPPLHHCIIKFPTNPPNSSLLRRGIRHCDVL